MANDYTRHHYVPQWYQKKFMMPGQTEYYCMDLFPEEFRDAKGGKHFAKSVRKQGALKCFVEDDLYTTKRSPQDRPEFDLESNDVLYQHV